ncbi:MAG: hypothetical protein V4671_22440 [Armatimonadota bacterium]
MRITKQGNDRVGYQGKWECEYCGCEWEYDENDERPAQLVRLVNDNVYSLPCPECASMAQRPVPKLSDVTA